MLFMLRSWASETLKQLYVCTYTMQPKWHTHPNGMQLSHIASASQVNQHPCAVMV